MVLIFIHSSPVLCSDSNVKISVSFSLPLFSRCFTADIEAACNAIEELEDTARLAMMTRGMNARLLNASQVKSIVKKFDVEWGS